MAQRTTPAIFTISARIAPVRIFARSPIVRSSLLKGRSMFTPDRSGPRPSLPGRAIQAVFLSFRHSRLLAPATMQQRSLPTACSSFA
jgi:hypothetical protein